jgi:hypothetical protein
MMHSLISFAVAVCLLASTIQAGTVFSISSCDVVGAPAPTTWTVPGNPAGCANATYFGYGKLSYGYFCNGAVPYYNVYIQSDDCTGPVNTTLTVNGCTAYQSNKLNGACFQTTPTNSLLQRACVPGTPNTTFTIPPGMLSGPIYYPVGPCSTSYNVQYTFTADRASVIQSSGCAFGPVQNTTYALGQCINVGDSQYPRYRIFTAAAVNPTAASLISFFLLAAFWATM